MSKAFELLLEVYPRRPAMPADKVIRSIDWARLRQQKSVLTQLLMDTDRRVSRPVNKADLCASLEGILNLIDDIQDCGAQMGQPSYEQVSDIVKHRQVGKANNP